MAKPKRNNFQLLKVNMTYLSLITRCVNIGFVKTIKKATNLLLIATEEEDESSLYIFLTIYDNQIYLVTFGPKIYRVESETLLENILIEIKGLGTIVSIPDATIMAFEMEEVEGILFGKIDEFSSRDFRADLHDRETKSYDEFISYLNALDTLIPTQNSDIINLLMVCKSALGCLLLEQDIGDFLDFHKKDIVGKSIYTVDT